MAEGQRHIEYAPDDLEHCPDHPDGRIAHVQDADFYVLNGEATKVPFRKRHVQYECAECGRVLASAPTKGE